MIYLLNLERYVTGLAEMGASTRGSEQIQIIAERVGSEQIFAQRAGNAVRSEAAGLDD